MQTPVKIKVNFRKWPTFVFYFSDGSTKSFTEHISKDAAQAKLQLMRDRLALGTFDFRDFFPKSSISKNLHLFAKEYLAYRENEFKLGNIAKPTLDKDIYSFKLLLDFFGSDAHLSLVTEKRLRDFIVDLLENKVNQYGRTYSPVSINGYMKHLSAAFSYARRKGYISHNPFSEIGQLKTSKTRKALSDDEILAFRSYFASKPAWQRDSFNFALWTGCRRSSIVSIKKDDFELKMIGGHDYYLLRLREKGEKERLVPLIPEVLEIFKRRAELIQDEEKMKAELDRMKSPADYNRYLERGRQGFIFFDVLDKSSITHAFTKAARALGIKHVTFHSLRHTYATRNLEAGNNVVFVQQLLGHSDIKTTMGYLDPTIQMILNGFLERFPKL